METDLASRQGERQEGVITLVLTADNHLGCAGFGQHPRKREERQQRLRQAFQQATNFAIMQGVDLFIQAGDLFDTATPDERDRSFVAERLAQLKQAGIHTLALGGVHDTPAPLVGETAPAPQMSYAQLGALHYFPPVPAQESAELEPVMIDVRGTRVGFCGRGVLPGQQGDPLLPLRVSSEIERADLALLLLHAPIEGLTSESSLLDSRAVVSQSSIARQEIFRYVLAGYTHSYQQLQLGQTDVIVAGATQQVDFQPQSSEPGFVFLGLTAEGIRWCTHVRVESLTLNSLLIQTRELWSAATTSTPTELILERMRPFCHSDAMLQIRLEGELTRSDYHRLDLNQIRRYGEEHCFALAIDDSALSLLPEQDASSVETGERFSPREELIALAEEWIAATSDVQEKQALTHTKEELLLAMDEMKRKR
ncbi:metallophosphoesterase family protein [Tengunoibacter tsumagoiensis]|uniref:metallophosphoesterase family protein n=1 Tax=Tengunoibacter tsumagoiensis TaxID=2014871 RepID=UPI0013870959|nr:metallophosphoesterase [Tengunoibacter tsumagoiensis]